LGAQPGFKPGCVKGADDLVHVLVVAGLDHRAQFGFGASCEVSISWVLVTQYRAIIVGAYIFVMDADRDSQFTQAYMISARLHF